MRQIRLVSGFITVGVWTLLSRILGFVRDVMIAAILGAGPAAEAFLVAFALPNMFRRFFAEGAFNMAFVPMFSKRYEAGQGALRFAQDAFSGLTAILVVFTLAAQLVMPFLVLAMAAGFAADERLALAVDYARIAFPYILLVSLAALLSGILNATGRFTAAAAAPMLLNLSFIVALLIADRFALATGQALAWAIPVAGVLQLAMLWVVAARAGFALVPRWPRLTPEMKRLAIIAAPAMLAGGVMQVNLLVGRQVGSFFEGAIAWLSYADRLYQLPLGVVGIAIGIVLLPDLSRRLQNGDTNGGRHSFSRAAEFALALAVPCAVGLMVIPVQIVDVLFERGAFTAADTTGTALAVFVYAVGLPAFVLQKVLQPLFFAREDTRSPFRYALASLVVNAVLAIGLAPFIGFIAAAIGTTAAGWAMVWLLWRGSRSMGEAARPDARFVRRVWRIVVAAAVMGVCVYLAAELLTPLLEISRLRIVTLVALILTGFVAYFWIGARIGAFAMADFRDALRR